MSVCTCYFIVCLFRPDCTFERGRIQAAWGGAEAHQRADPKRKRSTAAANRRSHSQKYVPSQDLAWSSLFPSRLRKLHKSSEVLLPSWKPQLSEPQCFPLEGERLINLAHKLLLKLHLKNHLSRQNSTAIETDGLLFWSVSSIGYFELEPVPILFKLLPYWLHLSTNLVIILAFKNPLLVNLWF